MGLVLPALHAVLRHKAAPHPPSDLPVLPWSFFCFLGLLLRGWVPSFWLGDDGDVLLSCREGLEGGMKAA